MGNRHFDSKWLIFGVLTYFVSGSVSAGCLLGLGAQGQTKQRRPTVCTNSQSTALGRLLLVETPWPWGLLRVSCLGPSLVPFGVPSLDPLGSPFGTIWGPFWIPLGAHVDPHLGSLLGPICGPLWVPFWIAWALSGGNPLFRGTLLFASIW